jgi:hypothetical protein
MYYMPWYTVLAGLVSAGLALYFAGSVGVVSVLFDPVSKSAQRPTSRLRVLVDSLLPLCVFMLGACSVYGLFVLPYHAFQAGWFETLVWFLLLCFQSSVMVGSLLRQNEHSTEE